MGVSVCLLVPFLAIFISHQLSTSFSTQVVGHRERPIELDTVDQNQHGWSNTPATSGKHFLVAILFSTSLTQREAIRNTWKRYSNASDGSHVLFVVGIKQIPTKEHQAISAEQAKHNDMVLLKDVHADSGNNIRVFHTFRWLDKNLKYTYVLISNDYCFVRLDKLTQDLRTRTNQIGLYQGYFVGNAMPQATGMWAENNWFLCDRYLPYALSGGYILSSDVVNRVMLNSDLIQLYNNEDVTVGVWTSAFNIERKHDIQFNVEAMSRGCRNDFTIICSQTAEDLKTKYTRLQKGLPLCVEEEVFREHGYNWTAKPSKCCDS